MEAPPEDCPGPLSETAGKESNCAGCPNQALCASGEPRKPDADVIQIKERLVNVTRRILVLSGKGGVGKSTVSTNISFALSNNPELNVGLLDLDICGPSLPKMTGLEGEQVHQSNSGKILKNI
jgi:Mrp family chromosome partitioning ATPase